SPAHPARADGLRLNVHLTHGFEPPSALFREDSSGDIVPISVERPASGASLVAPLTSLPHAEGVWGITLSDHDGNRRLLHWSDERWDRLPLDTSVFLEQRSGGALRLVRGELPLTANEVQFSDYQISVLLSKHSTNSVERHILRGQRATMQAEESSFGRFLFDLDYDAWGK